MSIPVLANDGDSDGDPITIARVSNVIGGTASFTGTEVTFTANTGATSGSFNYTIRDPGDLRATASVSVTISAANRPPRARDDSASTLVGVTINSIDVLGNDSDPDGDTLTITSVGAVTGAGSVSLNGSTISFTPGASAGTDLFSYTISDGKGGTASAVVSVTVTAPPVNQPPIAVFDNCNQALGVTSFTCNLIGNDSDPENDPISITGYSASSDVPGALLSHSRSNGILTFTVDPTQPQTITISYTLSDGTHSVTGTAGAKIA